MTAALNFILCHGVAEMDDRSENDPQTDSESVITVMRAKRVGVNDKLGHVINVISS